MRKENILKYKEYLKESLNPWYVKNSMKSFNKQDNDKLTITGDLKDLSEKLTNELSNIELPYNKLIQFGGVEIDISIIKTNTKSVYSKVSWNNFINNDYNIPIEVPENYDNNYLVSTIIHEIRHMIDFSDIAMSYDISSFDLDMRIRKFKTSEFDSFYRLLYISLEHELVARNNQIYPYIKFKNLSKNDSLEILKSSFIWRAIELLKTWNLNHFFNNFKSDDYLISKTNEFIKDVLGDENTILDNKNDVIEFYNKFNNYFIEISDKWESIILKEHDKIYERKIYNDPETLFKGYDIYLKDIWKSINN